MTGSREARWLALAALTLTGLAVDAAARPQPKAAAWQADLRQLATELPKRHANLFARMSREAFERAGASLAKRLPELQGHEVAVELARLVAMVGDGHTELSLTQPALGFRRYPLGLYVFGDELYAVSAASEHAEVVGNRLLRIGDTSIEAAYALVRPLISHDNEMEFRHSGPEYLSHAEILHALRIIAEPGEARWTFANEAGGERTVTIAPVDRASLRTDGWRNVTEAAGNRLPLCRRRRAERYWYEYLPKSRTLYFKYDACSDQDGRPSLSSFIQELFEYVDAHEIDRLVVDLRDNPGGNFHKSRPLIDALRKRPKLSQKGRLFAVTGRRTFSAGMMTALLLQKEVQAILVGETSRGRPNGSNNMERLKLPNSGIIVDYTDKLHEPAPELGDSPYLPVDLSVSVSFEDYKSGRDPVLERILASIL